MPMVKILYDNKTAQKGFISAHGFSALVEYGGKNILFDTGGRGDLLISNMKKLGISPKTVDTVFLSHNHWDHIGGLFSILAKNNKAMVFVPASFSEEFRNEIKRTGAKCRAIDGFTKISNNVYSTGQLGQDIKEQSLIVDTPKGIIIITGCAHPGIVNIVRHSKNKLHKSVYLVLGGFHLSNRSGSEIEKIIKDFKKLGVGLVGPCHCTGEKAIKMFEDAYQKNFIRVGVGSVINIKDLSGFDS